MTAADRETLRIFAGSGGRELAESMAQHLNLRVSSGSADRFPDGEVIVRVQEDVRGRDCFVVQSTCEPVNDRLVELLVWIDCLRRASARRITAVVPYFGYARQDRKDEGRVPITAKLVANMLTEAGADRVLCLDLHAAQIQGFFDIPVDHVTAVPIFKSRFEKAREELGDLTLVSPDVGNVKTANLYADALGADLAIVDKRRQSGEKVVSRNLIGDVEGRSVLMVDDMISTAGTLTEAARLCRERGATRVWAAATHAVFVGPAIERLADPVFERVLISDSIPDRPRLDPIRDKLEILSTARLLGEAVHRIHHDLSVSALFRTGKSNSSS